MKQKSITASVANACEEYGLRDPVELLTGLTNGVDLRQHSAVYRWLQEWEQANEDEPPDQFDWAMLCELIKNEGRFVPVTTAESLTAQKTLLEYLHSKHKSIDVNVGLNETAVTPLTREEIKLFERKFNRKV